MNLAADLDGLRSDLRKHDNILTSKTIYKGKEDRENIPNMRKRSYAIGLLKLFPIPQRFNRMLLTPFQT